MPIRLLLEHDHSFAPEEVATLVSAFEGVLHELRLVDREDPATLLVARTIVHLAKEGERDPGRLRDITITTLTK